MFNPFYLSRVAGLRNCKPAASVKKEKLTVKSYVARHVMP
jgi:hypothetical protein